MGQSISEYPPEHRRGEYYSPYDVNAWRRLSQTYLDQITVDGRLTREELDLIELERYWHHRRRMRQPRIVSLSPVAKKRRQRDNQARYANSSSEGNIPNGFHQPNGSGRKPVWKNFEESSHLTRNNHYQYHSLADLSRVKPNRNQIENLRTDLNQTDGRGNYVTLKNGSNSTLQRNLNRSSSGFDSSFNSYSSNEPPTEKFERNRNHTFDRNRQDVTDHGDYHIRRNNQQSINDRYPRESPMIFKEYSPNVKKLEEMQQQHRQQQQQQPNKNRQKNGKSYDDNNNVRLKSCLRESPNSSRDSTSPNSFNRNDSTQTTTTNSGRKSNQSFSQDDQTERIVERLPTTFESSFHRRQRQSQAPKFRINSQEHLNPKNIASNGFPQKHTQRKFNSNNHVHFKVYDSDHSDEKVFEDETDNTDTDTDDETDFLKKRGKTLMKAAKNNNHYNNGTKRTESLGSSSRTSSTFIPYKGYYLDMEHPHYSSYYQSFDRPHIGYTKCIYILLLFINISCVIWNSVYLHIASTKIQLGEPINGRLYSMSVLTRHIWQGSVITMLVINCLLSIFAIYATFMQKYWSVWTTTVLLYLVAAFGAYTEFQRGSVSAWFLPLICGHCGVVLTHQIAIKHYSN